jgi:hypothetical protein
VDLKNSSNLNYRGHNRLNASLDTKNNVLMQVNKTNIYSRKLPPLAILPKRSDISPTISGKSRYYTPTVERKYCNNIGPSNFTSDYVSYQKLSLNSKRMTNRQLPPKTKKPKKNSTVGTAMVTEQNSTESILDN